MKQARYSFITASCFTAGASISWWNNNLGTTGELLIFAGVFYIDSLRVAWKSEKQCENVVNLARKITWAENNLAMPERDIDDKLNLAWNLVDKYKL